MDNRLSRLVTVTWVLPVCLSGVEATLAHAAGGDPRQGRAIYETHCQLCHGPQGKGNGQFGQVTNPPAADFTSAASKNEPDAALLAAIRDGRPLTAMEGWKGQLSDIQIHDVLAYVKSLRE